VSKVQEIYTVNPERSRAWVQLHTVRAFFVPRQQLARRQTSAHERELAYQDFQPDSARVTMNESINDEQQIGDRVRQIARGRCCGDTHTQP
jgi:hypothetical protein